LRSGARASRRNSAGLPIFPGLAKLDEANKGKVTHATGETNLGWDDSDLDQMKKVPASAFEVVKLGTIITK
jgi:hypothetical protein